MMPGSGKPAFPLNLLSDFAGGGLLCALGIVLALFARHSSGKGQVVDVDMISGARYISTYPLLHYMTPGSLSFGRAREDGGDGRGTGFLDGGAPFYGVYTCKDGKWMSVGCLEPHFFSAFVQRIVAALPKAFLDNFGWTPGESTQMKREEWPQLRDFMEKAFLLKTRDEWAKVFAGMHPIRLVTSRMSIFVCRFRCLHHPGPLAIRSRAPFWLTRPFAPSNTRRCANRQFGGGYSYDARTAHG